MLVQLVGRSVARLVRWIIDEWVDRWIRRLLGWVVDGLIGEGRLLECSFGRSIGRLNQSVGWMVSSRSVDRLVGRSVFRSFGWLVVAHRTANRFNEHPVQSCHQLLPLPISLELEPFSLSLQVDVAEGTPERLAVVHAEEQPECLPPCEGMA